MLPTPPSSRFIPARGDSPRRIATIALGLFVSVTASSLVLAIASPAFAARVENTLTGSVLSTTGTAPGTAGISRGTNVTIVVGVESTTSGVSTPAGTSYSDAITDITVTAGSLTATLDPNGILNSVIVANDLNSPPVDLYSVAGFVIVPAAWGAGTNINLIMSEFGSSAISSDAVGQDLSDFDTGTFTLGGTGGFFSVLLENGSGGGGGIDLPRIQQTCLGGQVSAGGNLCKAVLACYSKQAKAPSKDPLGEVLDACIAKAEDKFYSSFDKATSSAIRSGGQCLAVDTSIQAALSLADDLDPITALIETGSDPNSKEDAKLRAALFKTASKSVASLLKAEAKDVKKPDAEKLQKAIDKAESGVVKAVGKAVDKAAKKGVVTDITPQEVIDAVNLLVDGVVGIAEGTSD